ncbi:MAG: 2OG-Fe(II) oxygenase family protein [Planctomycetota bacterium]|jgi:hypothetical protein
MTFLRRPAPAAHRRHDPLGVVPRPTRADGAVRSVAEYFAHDVDHAQPHAGAELRGIAAHLDFSLVTLTLQDDVGGLEVRRPDGRWLAVPCRPATWLVHVGELLQYASGNRLVATPHRVVNPSSARTRCSFPVFVNPALDCVSTRPAVVVPCAGNPPPGDASHVHAVLAPQEPPATLAFGPAEWRRKGENVWCRACCAVR